MTTLIICLFIALLLPYIAKGPVAYAMAKTGGYNNNHPREQQSQLTGFGARALAAHQNAFESLIIFAPAILLAIATSNTSALIVNLALTHVASRLVYNVLYLADVSTLRTLVWFVGVLSSFTIVYLCIP